MMARALQYRVHFFLRGQCDLHEIGHPIVDVILLEIVRSVHEGGWADSGCDRAGFRFLCCERLCQRVDHFLH